MQIRDPPLSLITAQSEMPCTPGLWFLCSHSLRLLARNFFVALGNWWHWWCLKPHCSWCVFILCVLGLFSWCAAAPVLSCSRNPEFALPDLLNAKCGALEKQVCSWNSTYSGKSSSSAEGIIVTIVSEVFWHLFVKLLQNVHRVDPLF